MDGRTERRLEAMRRVQAHALELFEEHGVDAVSVEAIARAAGVGPASVYRNFGTKERIVLWDDYDPQLLAAIRARLPARDPLAAVLEAITASVGRVYAIDKTRILRRTRLMLAHAQLADTARADRALLATALALLFESTRSFGKELERRVAAHAIVATLEAAVLDWAAHYGRRSLERTLVRAFNALRNLDSAVDA